MGGKLFESRDMDHESIAIERDESPSAQSHGISAS